ncbi:hypothetical protein LEMLEM_LOCUS16560, partial [Lemmus lemmus]
MVLKPCPNNVKTYLLDAVLQYCDLGDNHRGHVNPHFLGDLGVSHGGHDNPPFFRIESRGSSHSSCRKGLNPECLLFFR